MPWGCDPSHATSPALIPMRTATPATSVRRLAASIACWIAIAAATASARSEEHTSELQSLRHLVCRLLLEKKKTTKNNKARASDHNNSTITVGTTPRSHAPTQ